MKKVILSVFFVCLAGVVLGQSNVIGFVTDNLNRPIEGAKVSLVDSPSVFVQTSKNGKFSIRLSKGEKLMVTTPDLSRKIVVYDGGDLKIEMDESAESVIIDPMIQSQVLSETTSSTYKIKYDDIVKTSSSNISKALYGKGLGLSVMQPSNGFENLSTGLSIRGAQSLSGSKILVLVDGLERSITDVIPEEVESITLLKDAAATSLYGHKGINGALLITTKRGYTGKMKIKVSYDHGFTSPIRIPKFVDSHTYAKAMNEAYKNDGKGIRYYDEEIEAFKNGNLPYLYPNVDWWNETIGNSGHTNMYALSFQGGSDKMRYYTILELDNNQGFFKNTETNEDYSNQWLSSKVSIRSNIDINLSNNTLLQINIMGKLAEVNHSKPSDIMTNLYTVPSAAFPIKTEDGIWGGNTTWPSMNPVANLQAKGYSRAHERTLWADMTLTQNLDFITEGLRASIRLGYDNAVTYWERRGKTYAYASDNAIIENGHITEQINRVSGGKDTELSFNKMNGPMYYRFNFIGVVDYTKYFDNSKLYTSFKGSLFHDVSEGQHNTFNNVNMSIYSHYGLYDRYFLDFSLVASGSNRFPVNDKYSLSPTFSAAWLLSKESFLKDFSWINMLKLRASAGILYSDYVPQWNITSEFFTQGGGYRLTDDVINKFGMVRGRIPTSNFKPERAIKYNLGIDACLFDGLNFVGDIYYQRRDHIMVDYGSITGSVLGETAPYEPVGRVDSKGLELGLDYEKTFGDFTLWGGGNFSYSTNIIKEQLESPVNEEYLRTTGHSIGQPFGLISNGFFKDEYDILSSYPQNFSDVKPGDIKYIDQNDDKVIDSDDRKPIGYSTSIPEIYYSFNAGMEYRGIGVDMLFQGVGHYSAWLNTVSVYRPLSNNSNISQFYYDNRWTPNNLDAKFPRLSSEPVPNNNQNSDLWLADASFLKLRYLELYYKLPKTWLSKVKISSAKLYLRGEDLLSIDNMDIFDPENVGANYPSERSIHLGLKVEF